MDVYEDFKTDENTFDLDTLREAVDSSHHYYDTDGKLWFVTTSDQENFNKLENPIENSSFEYSTTSGLKGKKNINRNWYLKLPYIPFTFFRYRKKRYRREETIVLYLNSVPISFGHIEDERLYNCICFNRKM